MASRQKKQDTRDSAAEGGIFDVEAALRRFVRQKVLLSPGKRYKFRSLPDDVEYEFVVEERESLEDRELDELLEWDEASAMASYLDSIEAKAESLSLEEPEELDVLLNQALHTLRGCDEVASRISALLDRISNKTEDVSVAYRELLTS